MVINEKLKKKIIKIENENKVDKKCPVAQF